MTLTNKERLAWHAMDLDDDGHSGGYSWKRAVRGATTANITIATALNAGDSLDGLTLAAGDRILVKDQSAGDENGIYVVGPEPFRAADFDTGAEVLGATIPVVAGTANAGTSWRVTNTTAPTIDTDAITFAQFDAPGGGGAPTTADYLVGTAQGGLSAEIVVGTSPGGELGGTWASPTVDATHAGGTHLTLGTSPSTQAFGDAAAGGAATDAAKTDHKHAMPANPVTAHEAAGDPHTGYRLESADHSHASTGLQGGTIDHGALTGLSDDDHPQYATNTEFDDHSARHENGGADEISLAGLDGTPTELTNHINDTSAAHAASAISIADAGSLITATDVEGALQELAPAFDLWVGNPHPGAPGSSSVFVANRVYLTAFTVQKPVSVSTAKFEVVTSSGSVCLGIYDDSGTRLATTGSTACPAAGLGSISLTGSVSLSPGVRYWAAIEADNGTAAARYLGGQAVLITNFKAATHVDSTFPLAASLSLTFPSANRVYAIYFA
jgi:hypothetical protein